MRRRFLQNVCFGGLLISLLAIVAVTFPHVEPPVTDEALFGFIKSDRYLGKAEMISRSDLYTPVQKLLTEVRAGYKTICLLSGVALLCSFGLFYLAAGSETVCRK